MARRRHWECHFMRNVILLEVQGVRNTELRRMIILAFFSKLM